MGSFVFSVIQGASISIRRQQLAPKLSTGIFVGGQIDREAKTIPEASKGTVKIVVCHRRSNSRGIQVMELVD